jgi:hypothetical protein
VTAFGKHTRTLTFDFFAERAERERERERAQARERELEEERELARASECKYKEALLFIQRAPAFKFAAAVGLRLDTPSGAGSEGGEAAEDVRQVAGEKVLQVAGERGVAGAAGEEDVARKNEDKILKSEILEADSRRDVGVEDVMRMRKGAASTAEDEVYVYLYIHTCVPNEV